MSIGIVELDLHGRNVEQAQIMIDSALRKTGNGTYRIRLIHGYHGGTAIREMIYEEYGYCRNEKVKRIENGTNPGITELVLREY